MLNTFRLIRVPELLAHRRKDGSLLQTQKRIVAFFEGCNFNQPSGYIQAGSLERIDCSGFLQVLHGRIYCIHRKPRISRGIWFQLSQFVLVPYSEQNWSGNLNTEEASAIAAAHGGSRFREGPSSKLISQLFRITLRCSWLPGIVCRAKPLRVFINIVSNACFINFTNGSRSNFGVPDIFINTEPSLWRCQKRLAKLSETKNSLLRVSLPLAKSRSLPVWAGDPFRLHLSSLQQRDKLQRTKAELSCPRLPWTPQFLMHVLHVV